MNTARERQRTGPYGPGAPLGNAGRQRRRKKATGWSTTKIRGMARPCARELAPRGFQREAAALPPPACDRESSGPCEAGAAHSAQRLMAPFPDEGLDL
ncbi:unnamed protein product [Prorocentrum cordatum]|uniref:Uncharacterized protein n=1 Tax=Prorocentrum cordatum TaxID=2364126 RepID=A0ABN9V689_9DINO|nr:unnamed protein product [Polarella glacialis]